MALGMVDSQVLNAQQPAKVSAEQLIGTWTLLEVYYTTQDGKRVDSLGANPRGRLRLNADGTFTCQIMRLGLPKFKSNNREKGTAEENKAVVQGTISYYGTYKVNVPEQFLAMHIEACSYPNFDGVEQKRPFTLKGDTLSFINRNSSVAGSTVHQTWKRIK
jgi:hypothetical protein